MPLKAQILIRFF